MPQLNSSIVIIGKISSGKSTLAKDISGLLEFSIASFGGYLFDYSKRKNLATDRDSLQNLGDSFIQDNPIAFLQSVISHSVPGKTAVIFEGVRHKSILDEIQAISDKSFSIFLDIPEDIRLERFVKRHKEIDAQNNAVEDFYKRSLHPVEKEIDSLKDQCGVVITSENDYQKLLTSSILQHTFSPR